MLEWLKQFSQQRRSWLLLLLTASGLQLTALYFQYGMGLEPCMQCVYIRAAVAGIMLAALLGLLAPGSLLLRLSATLGWLAAAGYGWLEARKLSDIEQLIAEGGFYSCALFADFPDWLPLHEWLPALFDPIGPCGAIDWQFAGASMADWMRWIFIAYGLVALLVLACQWVRINPNPYKG
ncbi:MAG: disulfide bond formation protein DsbB [Alkalimonas sp.]|uniref:Disulfide bond formation protein B n=1 Tax=Alkalimonas delamerensis TaxID=265981 RepID=A0ABT9GNG0_9GAMM|nr:disulfide bond formation protein DsbB [Alkalimonas delamerensis]MCC5853248.1 disulfide bond formation protein DsbB [Alkalimonas sp.]MDP4528191.1 disulfide bond formation protein DsbB [Alkalimonas delamerensis]